MLKPKKRITKKEMKQDALVTTYAKLTSYYYANKKIIGYVAFALVVVVLAVFVYLNNRRANNEKATAALGKVFSLYDAAATDPVQYTTAIDGQPERGLMGLKAIVENYGGTDAGEIARIYLANSYYAQGKVDEAIVQYESFRGSDALLAASAEAGRGACYEIKKQYAKAASSFEKASGKTTDMYEGSDYLNSAARCYGLAGEKEKAIALYKRLKKDFPNSPFARDADRYIAQFSV